MERDAIVLLPQPQPWRRMRAQYRSPRSKARYRAMKCFEKGCAHQGIAFPAPWSHNRVQFFCATHAVEGGYCAGCGGFWAGVEYFDRHGYCENCKYDYEDLTDYYSDESLYGYADSYDDYLGEKY